MTTVAVATSETVDVALRDGSTVRVRPTGPADEDALAELLESLSAESRWLRFFSAGADVRAAARHAARIGEQGGFGLVAVTGDDERMIGHAEYALERPRQAEVAFEVAEDWQGRGIATVLLAHLAHAADAAGIDTFRAYVLPENHRMASVFRESGFPVHIESHDGELVLDARVRVAPARPDRPFPSLDR